MRHSSEMGDGIGIGPVGKEVKQDGVASQSRL